MAKPLASTMDEAKSLGFTATTRSITELHALIDEQLNSNLESHAFRKDCMTVPQGGQCLQTDCGSDGWEYVGFCNGISCELARRRCTR